MIATGDGECHACQPPNLGNWDTAEYLPKFAQATDETLAYDATAL